MALLVVLILEETQKLRTVDYLALSLRKILNLTQNFKDLHNLAIKARVL
jgi:hypothetical protein